MVVTTLPGLAVARVVTTSVTPAQSHPLHPTTPTAAYPSTPPLE